MPGAVHGPRHGSPPLEVVMKHITPEERAQGWASCPHCDEYAHAIRASVLQGLPRDYYGENCQRCGLFMCRKSLLVELTEKPRAVPDDDPAVACVLAVLAQPAQWPQGEVSAAHFAKRVVAALREAGYVSA